MYCLLICTGQLKLERGGQFDRFFQFKERLKADFYFFPTFHATIATFHSRSSVAVRYRNTDQRSS